MEEKQLSNRWPLSHLALSWEVYMVGTTMRPLLWVLSTFTTFSVAHHCWHCLSAQLYVYAPLARFVKYLLLYVNHLPGSSCLSFCTFPGFHFSFMFYHFFLKSKWRYFNYYLVELFTSFPLFYFAFIYKKKKFQILFWKKFNIFSADGIPNYDRGKNTSQKFNLENFFSKICDTKIINILTMLFLLWYSSPIFL